MSELDGEIVETGAGDGDEPDSGRKGGRAEGLMGLAAWFNGDIVRRSSR